MCWPTHVQQGQLRGVPDVGRIGALGAGNGRCAAEGTQREADGGGWAAPLPVAGGFWSIATHLP